MMTRDWFTMDDAVVKPPCEIAAMRRAIDDGRFRHHEAPGVALVINRRGRVGYDGEILARDEVVASEPREVVLMRLSAMHHRLVGLRRVIRY